MKVFKTLTELREYIESRNSDNSAKEELEREAEKAAIDLDKAISAKNNAADSGNKKDMISAIAGEMIAENHYKKAINNLNSYDGTTFTAGENNDLLQMSFDLFSEAAVARYSELLALAKDIQTAADDLTLDIENANTVRAMLAHCAPNDYYEKGYIRREYSIEAHGATMSNAIVSGNLVRELEALLKHYTQTERKPGKTAAIDTETPTSGYVVPVVTDGASVNSTDMESKKKIFTNGNLRRT